MSGDIIKNLKKVEQPLNRFDLEYTAKLLEPFDDLVIERFTATAGGVNGSRLFALIAIILVLVINFPKIKENAGINPYVLWLISATILFGVVY
jgi:hypothetical protein